MRSLQLHETFRHEVSRRLCVFRLGYVRDPRQTLVVATHARFTLASSDRGSDQASEALMVAWRCDEQAQLPWLARQELHSESSAFGWASWFKHPSALTEPGCAVDIRQISAIKIRHIVGRSVRIALRAIPMRGEAKST